MLTLIGFSLLFFGAVSRTENITCSNTCSPSPENTEQPCNITSGDCLYGCLPGYAGQNCSVECPSNCFRNKTETCSDTTKITCVETATCIAITGECIHGCNHGFAGPNCSVECPQNCAASDKSGVEICNITTKECLFGCTDGFYGPNCTTLCNNIIQNCETCVSKEDNSGIDCTRCKRNFYRNENKRCQECNYFCLVVPNQELPLCREDNGTCQFGCREGRYGDKCDFRCKSLCDGSCQRETGACLNGCTKLQYCGPTCVIQCQDGCLSQHCNQSCGCVKGCKPNRWGEKCNKLCNRNCVIPTNTALAICDNSDGACIYGCNGNQYWGNDCEETCSDSCLNGTCQQNTGNCTEGCTSKAVWGWGCNFPCSENCLGGKCERSDGYCSEGCTDGSYGDGCGMTCNETCTNGTCMREDGYCKLGCKVGNYGDHCDLLCSERCLDKKCERADGTCTDGYLSGYEGIYCKKGKKTNTGMTTGEDEAPISDQHQYMTLRHEQGNTNEAANYETLKQEGMITRQKDYVNLEMNQL